jgi:DNA-binding IclR family transcriptional regulator
MERDDVQGIQSIELGGSVLNALIDAGGTSLPLREVASAAGMSASKARRYLLSFARIGLVAQDETTGYYGLGPLAVRLGLAAIAAIAIDAIAPPFLRELRSRLQETIVLAVWNDNGPTILQVQDSRRSVTLTARIGSTLLMTRSATGAVFGAFYDSGATEAVVAAEIGSSRLDAKAKRELLGSYERRVAEVREHGVGRVQGEVIAGISSLSAPVFDHNGLIVAAIGVLGNNGVLDVGWDANPALELRRSAAILSERCGFALVPRPA